MLLHHGPHIGIAGILLIVLAGCEEERAAEAPTEIVARGVLHLTAEQQAKLGMAVELVARRDVKPERKFSGIVALRPACEVVVKSPMTGFVAPAEGETMTLGTRVERDKPLGIVRVLLSPQEEAQLVALREEVDTAIRQSELSMRLAKTQMDRLSSAGGVVATTRLEELADTYEKSQVSLEEAKQKLPYLPTERADKAIGLRPVDVAAPLDGVLTAVFVRYGQFVLQGDPLWTLEDRSKVWVRVGVYDADLPQILRDEPVAVLLPGVKEALVAQPVELPLTNKPDARFVELTYEVDNPHLALRPGQTVTAVVPLTGRSREVVVPASAVLLDGQDNAWVYAQTAPTEFRRSKVELGGHLADGGIVVRRGLAEGERIVTVAAQSLYGEEFKTEIQVEEGENEAEEERERERKRG